MHRGCFLWTSSPPLAGRSTPRPGPVRVCVYSSVLARSGGPASWSRFGAPHLSSGSFVLLLCSAPSVLGLPLLWFFGCLPPPPRFFFLPAFPFSARPPCLFPVLGALDFGALFFFPPPPPPACAFFSSSRAPVVSGFLWFSARGALGLGAVCCLFCWPPAPRHSVCSRLLCGSRLSVGCSLVVVAPPPPFFVSRCFSRCRFVLRFFFFLVARPRGLRLSLGSGPGCPGLWRCVLFVLLASRSSALRALSPLLWFQPGRLQVPGGCCSSPPPSFVSRCFSRCRFVLPVFFSRCVAPLSLAFSGFGPLLLLASRSSAVRALSPPLWFLPGRWLLFGGCFPHPPPFCASLFFSLPLFAPLLFLVARPRCLWLSVVSGPGCPGPWRCVLIVLLASRSSAPRALSPLLWFPPGRWLLPGDCCPPPPPPPPSSVSRCFSRCRFLCSVFFSFFLFFSRCAPPLSLAFCGFRPRTP